MEKNEEGKTKENKRNKNSNFRYVFIFIVQLFSLIIQNNKTATAL